MPKLDAHKNDILKLLEQGKSQAEIIRHFAGRGVSIHRSTLSDFIRLQQEGEASVATLEDEGLQERMAASLAFHRSVADELIDRMIDLTAGIQQLKQEGDQHHSEVTEAINTVATPRIGSSTDDIKPLLEDAIRRLDALAARTGRAGLRYIWGKALLVTGLVWAAAITAFYLLATPALAVMWQTFLVD